MSKIERNEIEAALITLTTLSRELEQAYIDNEGEITDETEALEAQREAVKTLLTTDGVDYFGRWLSQKEAEAKMYQAEKAAAEARIKSAKKTIESIKAQIADILIVTDTDKVKGSFYSFAQAESKKTSVLTDKLDEDFLERASNVAKDFLPPYVDIALVTNSTRIKEYAEIHNGEGSEYLETTTSPSVRFTKPRAAKEA